VWQALPYRTPVIGWRSDVEKATVEVCRKFFSTYYAPNNIVVVITGDFDANDALAHIQRTLGKLRRASRSRATRPRSRSSAASGARSCTST
jgi:zinc protease